MSTWTYNLYGRPDGSLGVHTLDEQDEPGFIVVAERQDEPGVCDGYVLRSQNLDTRTAVYDWVAVGTPELVMPAVLRQVTERAQG